MRTGLIAIVISAAAAATVSAIAIAATVSTAGAAPSCQPPPDQVLVQVAQIRGSNPALLADVQAVEQADSTAGDKTAGQAMQDILAAASRDGYQWDCKTSRLVAPNLPAAAQAGAAVAEPGAAVAASGSGSIAGAAAGSSSGGAGAAATSSTTSGSGASVVVQGTPASSAGTTTHIPLPVIVIGLILCSAALFGAVRRVTHH